MASNSQTQDKKNTPIANDAVCKGGAVARRRQVAHMSQDVPLIWLIDNIDEQQDEDYQRTMEQLYTVSNNIKIFTDQNECIDFLSEMDDEKACLIISDSMGEHFVPFVHDMSQVDWIFILCTNKSADQGWVKNWFKIKGIFNEISLICDVLNKATRQYIQNSISIGLISPGVDASNKTHNELESSFMYTQILKEILLTTELGDKQLNDFITHCPDVVDAKDRTLDNIRELKRQYHVETPIWWYTFAVSVYSTLNRALREMDTGAIIKMGFFVNDLHRHIEELHKKQFDDNNSEPFTVYRGQGLSNSDFEQIRNAKDGLLSFNSFLSTSKYPAVSLMFAESNHATPGMTGILFVMKIDPSVSSTPFASIKYISAIKDEDEVLFSMHTVFRIRSVTQMAGENSHWQVELTLIGDGDPELRALTDHIREETNSSDNGWYRLGTLLFTIGHLDKAQQAYEILLEQVSTNHQKAPLFCLIGCIKYNQREYEEAIKFHEKAIQIFEETSPPDLSNLAMCYDVISMVYQGMGDDSKARSYIEKALEIQQNVLPSVDPDSKISYNNMGNMYREKREYPTALSYYEKALDIEKNTFPINNPALVVTYCNIANVYDEWGDHQEALYHCRKALEIQEETLPSNHPDFTYCYSQMGRIYNNMGNYSEAVSFYERAVQTGQRSLPADHPRLQIYRDNLEIAKNKL